MYEFGRGLLQFFVHVLGSEPAGLGVLVAHDDYRGAHYPLVSDHGWGAV